MHFTIAGCETIPGDLPASLSIDICGLAERGKGSINHGFEYDKGRIEIDEI